MLTYITDDTVFSSDRSKSLAVKKKLFKFKAFEWILINPKPYDKPEHLQR